MVRTEVFWLVPAGPLSGSYRVYWQNLGGRNFCFDGSPKKFEKHLYSFSSGQKTRDQHFEPLERTLRDPDRLADLNFRVNRDDLCFACSFLQGSHRLRIESCQVIAEMNDAVNSG